MALLLAGIGLLARLASERLGDAALFAVAAVSGLADVDAVTLSVAQLVPAVVEARVAAVTIAVAVASNILAKSAYALAIGGKAYGLRFGLASLAGLGAGAAALLFL
jgi:uncharacterized membrane protein (DUF4010 family)